MSKIITALFLDIETSGLEPTEGAVILSIGARLEKIQDSQVIDEQEWERVVKVTPEQWEKASPKALEVNGMTWDIVSAGKPIEDVRDEFIIWLVEHDITPPDIYIGQNPMFDIRFLEFFMGEELEFVGAPWTGAVVDVRSFYRELSKLKKVKYLKYASGKNISEALGVEPEDDVHEALEGARVVSRNFHALTKIASSWTPGIIDVNIAPNQPI